VLRASAAIERAGFPTVSIVSTGFLKQAEVVARGLGIDDRKSRTIRARRCRRSDELRRKVADELMPQNHRGLTSRLPGERKAEAQRAAPREIVSRGTLDQVNDHSTMLCGPRPAGFSADACT